LLFTLPNVLKIISNAILSAYFEIFIYLHNFKMIMGSIDDLNVEKLEMAANMMKAIAHPVRIAILKYLEGGKKLTVTEIYELLGIEQSTTSHHLGILKDKGILCSRREGKNSYYFLKHEILSQIIDCVNRCACDQLK
jgi:DNA-binding transcriptional ArsR family regulator